MCSNKQNHKDGQPSARTAAETPFSRCGDCHVRAPWQLNITKSTNIEIVSDTRCRCIAPRKTCTIAQDWKAYIIVAHFTFHHVCSCGCHACYHISNIYNRMSHQGCLTSNIAPTTHDVWLHFLHLGVLNVKFGDDLVVCFYYVLCQHTSSQLNIISHV